MLRLQQRGEAWRTLTRGGSAALCIAASALPLWMIQGIIEPLAGKTTVINAGIPLKVSIGASLVVNLAQYIRGTGRKRTIKRLRGRIDEFEQQFNLSTELDATS